MPPWAIVLIVLAVIAVLVLWAVGIYNGMVRGRNETKNAWSQIDVQLKRRYDLIPNLVETVKGYLKHERDTLEAVVRARQVAMGASGQGAAAQAQAEGQLTGALKSLFAVTEAYPDLKANENMLRLQEELSSTENKIGFARQAYNDSVMRYNNSLEVFPNSLLAGGFQKAEFFEVESAEERKAVKVQF
ncbi:MAG: LemA family protein [Planctomycetota bacterium]